MTTIHKNSGFPIADTFGLVTVPLTVMRAVYVNALAEYEYLMAALKIIDEFDEDSRLNLGYRTSRALVAAGYLLSPDGLRDLQMGVSHLQSAIRLFDSLAGLDKSTVGVPYAAFLALGDLRATVSAELHPVRWPERQPSPIWSPPI